MKLANRALMRCGAAAAGLIAAATAFAAPAYAGSTDVAVDLTGTTIAADSSGKFGNITVKNVGSTTPAEIQVIFDVSKVDTKKVEVKGCDEPENGLVYCIVPPELIPAPGATVDLIYPLVRVAGTGDAGKLKVTVRAEGDDNPANDSKTVTLSLGEHGVDLAVIADDVRNSFDAAGTVTDDLVKPGGTAVVNGGFVNQGDMTANGVRVTVTLPERATFADVEPGCDYSADNRTVTCDYPQIVLIPADADEAPGGDTSAGLAFFPLQVAADAAQGVSLKDGVFAVEAIEEVPYPSASTRKSLQAPTLPPNVKVTDASEFNDVDLSDNADEFNVILAAAPESNEGPLPVTGAKTGLIAGGGAAAVALGAVLFVATRRRRVVLVAPDRDA
jgi:hypothetical protein